MTPDPGIPEPASGAWTVIRRGVALSPEFLRGFPLTLLLALVAMAGRVVVPVTVQQAIDRGITGPQGPEPGTVARLALLAAVAVALTAAAAYGVSVRLYRSSEAGLAESRVRVFRHIHELSLVNQQSEQRGALVSRVTSDVDTVTAFLQYRGLRLVVSIAQVVLTTAVMAFYSWRLTLLVWLFFLPLIVFLRRSQGLLAERFGAVRDRVATLLGLTSESLVGAAAVRAYGMEERVISRADAAVTGIRHAQLRGQRLATGTLAVAELVPGLVNAGIVAAGVALIGRGDMSVGELVAVLFLAALFVAPVQMGVATLSEAQRAVAGWRRMLGVLDVRPEVADPGPHGLVPPRGPAEIRLEHVGFAYAEGTPVLHDVDLTIPAGTRVAVVGETGSGKTTFAKLVTRLMDPGSGRVLIGGVPLEHIGFAALRRSVVMVPQDGFLFDTTIAENVRHGAPGLDDPAVERAFAELGLDDWLGTLSAGVRTPVGQRGEALSAGERQLVALVRAHVARPDVLVLDEATSAVDPATEVRIRRAMGTVTDGRTSVFIAHRLATAEAADEVIVFDRGRVVERGPHHELAARDGVYAALHASWTAGTAPASVPRP
ncbi:ABC transporter ATP-binding protein [Streptomyces sp. NPDC046909]|uniref:ABC transporter ATP-binding protein n=1 Tax=Streptomyces sp. NPDC046909 TaxID=3155617 RepID=UPI0033F1DDA5